MSICEALPPAVRRAAIAELERTSTSDAKIAIFLCHHSHVLDRSGGKQWQAAANLLQTMGRKIIDRGKTQGILRGSPARYNPCANFCCRFPADAANAPARFNDGLYRPGLLLQHD